MPTDNRTLDEKVAERDAKLDALQAKLTDAVQQLVTGEDWRHAMEFAARFRARSFNNTLLIWVQHAVAHAEGRVPDPNPTYVAGFKQWQSLGRHVMRGQAGYQIFAPVTARMASHEPNNPDSWHRLGRGEKPAPGEVVRARMISVRPAYVWAQSQTEGEPLPETPKLLEGQAPAGLGDALADQITAHGFEVRLVSTTDAIGGANGLTDYLTHDVSVRMDLDDAAQVKTLAHELGHVILHGPDNTDAAMHRGVAEIEAARGRGTRRPVAAMAGRCRGGPLTAPRQHPTGVRRQLHALHRWNGHLVDPDVASLLPVAVVPTVGVLAFLGVTAYVELAAASPSTSVTSSRTVWGQRSSGCAPEISPSLA